MLGRLVRRLLTHLAVASLTFASAGTLFAQTGDDSRRAQRLLDRAQRDGRVRVIVGLQTEQAWTPEGNLSAPQAIRAQRNAIAKAQRELRLLMSRHSHDIKAEFNTIPFTALEVDYAGLNELVGSGVVSVEEDTLSAPTLGTTAGIINATEAWNLGAEGLGQAVAILDTGVEAGHSFFGSRVVYEGCYSSTVPTFGSTTLCPNGQESQLGSGAASPANCAGTGACDHGTHVAGIAAGSGASFHGVARKANIMAFQVFSLFSGPTYCGAAPTCLLSFTSDQLSALEQVYAQRNNLAIASANMSLGGGQYTSPCDSNSLAGIIGNLRSVGIATVISSGNSGYSNATGAPGCISAAVTVGSTTNSDTVSSFSNSASFVDLLAPGHPVYSSVTGGGFGYKSGTSMAAPQVTGAFALLKSANPTATVDDIENALKSTGVMITDTKPTSITKPRIKLDDALAALGSSAPSITTTSLPNATAGVSYSTTIAVSGGAPPLQFAIVSGVLPTGLTGPNGSGVISGTPSQVGAFPIRIRVTDNQNQTDERDFTVNVSLATPILSSPGNNSVTNNVNVTFSWFSVASATSYDLVVTRQAVTVLSQNVATTSFATSSLPDGNLQWTVTAKNGAVSTQSIAYAFELDTTAPSQISLSGSGPTSPHGTIQLDWVAPGDDASTGQASFYDIRYSPGSVLNYGSGTQVQNEPAPLTGTTPQSFQIQNLLHDTTYTVAMTTTDNAGNVAAVSNPVTVQTSGVPPEAIQNLSTLTLGMDTVRLSWSAPHEDGASGNGVASYEVRYATFPINDGNFTSASLAPNPPTPSSPGATDTLLVGNLSASTQYYFAVKSRDAGNNLSPISNVPSAVTDAVPDTTNPGAVVNLTTVPTDGSNLTLTALDNSGIYSAAFDMGNVVDGDNSTIWSTPGRPSPQPEHVTIDLGATVSLTDVRLRSRSDMADFFPIDFTIELSNDGQSFNVAHAETGFGAAPATEYTFAMNGASGRYVKVRSTLSGQTGGSYFVQLAEFSANAVPTPGILLSWTASGDDGSTGTAAEYDVRYQTGGSINFATATTVTNEPVPAVSGTPQSLLVANLTAGQQYTFGIQVRDEANNLSTIETAIDTTLGGADTTDPGAVTNFTATPTAGGSPTLSVENGSGEYDTSFSHDKAIDSDNGTFWSTPGRPTMQPEHVTIDLGGPVTLNQIRLRSRADLATFFPVDFTIDLSTDGSNFTTVHTETNFAAAAGTWYDFGISTQVAHYVRVRSTASNQTGGLYFVQIAELAASGTTVPGMLLSWTSSGDDGASGTATSFDIRYQTGGSLTFATATQFPSEPTPAVSGTTQSALIPGLNASTQYTFGIQARDEADNVSTVATVTQSTLADPNADSVDPGPVTGLSATPTLGGTPTLTISDSSGEYSSSFAASNLLDSAPNTLWSTPGRTSPQPEHVTVDLGQVMSLDDVRLRARADMGTFFPVNFTIDLSLDGSGFTTAHTETGFSAAAGSWHTFGIGTQSARYVRVRSTVANQTGGQYFVQIAEFEANGTTSPGMQLNWTASGDDGAAGTASSYDIRYQQGGTIDFANATQADGEPAPLASGQTQSFSIHGLTGSTQYTFAIQAMDDKGNVSALTTVTQTTLDDPNADTINPGPVTSLSATPVAGGTPTLTIEDDSGSYSAGFASSNLLDSDNGTLWSTPGRATPQPEHVTIDLGQVMNLDNVQLRARSDMGDFFPVNFTLDLSTDNASFTTAHTETGFSAAAGTNYTFAIGSQSARYVRIRSTVANHTSGLYFVQIAEFVANGTTPPAMDLSWTASGDDATVGTATSYDVRYQQGASIDFANATQATGEPAPLASGQNQSYTVSGLAYSTQYTFGIQVSDDKGNLSTIATVTQTTQADPSADATNPGDVTGLSATPSVGGPPTLSLENGSGSYGAGFEETNVVDGNLGTLWSTPGRPSPQPEHVTIDLGQVMTLNNVQLRSRSDMGTFFPVNFTIDLSTDGSNFTTAHTETGFAAAAATWYTFGTGGQQARYVRVRSTLSNPTGGLYYVQIAEFQVSGTSAPSMQLSWTASGDDGSTGSATSYDIRYQQGASITFATATEADGEPTPLTSGQSQSFSIHGLQAGTQYTFGIQAVDDKGNTSNVVTITQTTP